MPLQWYIIETARTEFGLQNKPEEYVITQLRRLRKAKLGEKRTAFITIDSEPCRTCLQFLNRLSQYTRIGFRVFGSQGIGPIIVRVNGQRREDVIGNVFFHSEDDDDGADPAPRGVIPPLKPATDFTTAPSRSVLQRPRMNWKGLATPWTPQDPEELLSTYKKKTPVYEFPGYDDAVRPSQTLPRPLALEVRAPVEDDGLREWEELGDGLMIRYFNTIPKVQKDNLVKHQPSEENFSNGYSYAYAAYETVSESSKETTTVEEDYEVIERPLGFKENTTVEGGYELIQRPRSFEEITTAEEDFEFAEQPLQARPRPRHYYHEALPSAGAGRPGQLQRFYYRPIRQSNFDESVLRSYFPIRQPRNHGYI